jgi:hypothetical protein
MSSSPSGPAIALMTALAGGLWVAGVPRRQPAHRARRGRRTCVEVQQDVAHGGDLVRVQVERDAVQRVQHHRR